jgi:hypothetical protein
MDKKVNTVRQPAIPTLSTACTALQHKCGRHAQGHVWFHFLLPPSKYSPPPFADCVLVVAASLHFRSTTAVFSCLLSYAFFRELQMSRCKGNMVVLCIITTLREMFGRGGERM